MLPFSPAATYHPYPCKPGRLQMLELIGGLISLIWVLIVFWAVVRTVQSIAPTGAKVIWILVLIFFPPFGMIMWLLIGPRRHAGP